MVARATGIDLDNVLDSAATTFSNTGNTNTISLAGLTTSNTTTLLVGGIFHENSAGLSPNTTSFLTMFQEYRTNPDGSVSNTGAAIGYKYLTTAGATGNVSVTLDNTATVYSGELVAFKAGAWSPAGGGGGSATQAYIAGAVTTYINTNAITSFTINTPTGYQNGDILVLALSGQASAATSDYTSAGWSRIGQSFIGSSSTYRLTGFYALPVTSGTSIASSYTFSDVESGAGSRVCATMMIIRNADVNNIVDVASPYAALSGSSVTVQPGTAAYNTGLLLVNYDAQFVSGVDYTVANGPTGMTQISTLITSVGAVSKTAQVLYQQNVNSGVQSPATLAWNGAPSQASGISIVIRGAGQTPANAGVAVKYTSATDTLSTAHLFYTSAPNTLATPKEVRPVPTGYSSVTDMLSHNPFYIAHRGGSADWPEMSLYAYTQSVFWGVGALEVSLARTSDGVWFGLHDASLDRTSLNSGGGSGTAKVASTMTWAEVQQYQIQYPASIANPSSLPQPYMRWEEIIAAYYTTHILVVDPKYASNYTSELLAKMDALPSSTSRFICKSFGATGNTANTTGFPHDATLHGYKNWGYFYESDYSNVPTYQGRFDILGMDYTATQNSWTQIMSYGKPVIGHICPTAAAATTAFGYGATGVMVSGVQETIPRSANSSG